MAQPVTIRDTRRPGDDALIVDLHARGYASHGERFGPLFCAFVAETLAEGRLDDPANGRIWFAETDGQAIGCAALVNRPGADGESSRGQLRWVVLLPEARGQGLGRQLVSLALDYAREQQHRSVFLETTDHLVESKTLYERLGFRTIVERPEELWHGEGVLIVMECPIPSENAPANR
jgi:GNAT superfamily N-acetyltransferase